MDHFGFSSASGWWLWRRAPCALLCIHAVSWMGLSSTSEILSVTLALIRTWGMEMRVRQETQLTLTPLFGNETFALRCSFWDQETRKQSSLQPQRKPFSALLLTTQGSKWLGGRGCRLEKSRKATHGNALRGFTALGPEKTMLAVSHPRGILQ